jgi:hypothetical protein
MSGSSGRSSSNQQQNVSTLNPIPILFGQAFGLNPQTQGGGLNFGAGQSPNFTNQLFGPSTFEPLKDLFTPTSTPQHDPQDLFGASAAGLGTLTEAAETGLIDPAVELSQQLFGDFLNQTQEELGSQLGLGRGDSDFAAILGREAQRSSTELANLAQDRRLAASTGIQDQVAQAISAQDLIGQGVFANSDAGQILNRLLTIAGVNTQGQGTGTGSSSSKQASGGLG